ncbi:MAG: hypothetical protein HXS48_25590 [Theionarchaea archaeon]|nr:hypothetical protein [Theionarchaea archaeon]
MFAKLITPGAKETVPQAYHCIGYGSTPGGECTGTGHLPFRGNCFSGYVPYFGQCSFGKDT